MVVAALACWAWVSVPLVLGQSTLCLRDVLNLHAPLKAFGAAELRHGRVPAINPSWGLGQPFRGNPNALALYPGNLLYLALPFWSAFGAHYALHWLLAFLAMRALARELGQTPSGALVAALTYAGSGYLLSALSFYNLLVVAAWWPLVAWGVARGGRRGIALAGLACGLALLGGDPITAALGLVPLFLLAIQRHGPRRGAVAAAAAVGLGLAVALPQIVAAARVLPFTYRGGHGMLPAEVGDYALHPARLIELVLPLPFGSPARLGVEGWWALEVSRKTPYFYSLYIGVMGLWLALAAALRRRAWTTLAASGLLLAVAGGQLPDLLTALTAGTFRYPEKFLFWFVFAGALLAGWGLEALVRRETPRWRGAALLGGLALGVALGVAWARPSLVAAAAVAVAARQPELAARTGAVLSAQAEAWALGLAAAGVLLVAGAWATRRRRAGVLVALQLVGLTQLSPLLARDDTAPYREPSPWGRQFAPGESVVNTELTYPRWEAAPPWWIESGSVCGVRRRRATELGLMPGTAHGLRYPFAPDVEGLSSPLHHLLLEGLPRLDWPARRNWLRVTGADGLVIPGAPQVDGLRRLARRDEDGPARALYRVDDSAPPIFWPRAVHEAASPADAFWQVSAAADPVGTAFVPHAVEHRPGGEARIVEETSDRLVIETSGPGGLVVLQRAYQPLYEACVEGRGLTTLPVNLVLLGAVVPPGEQRITIEVPAGAEKAAGAIALATAALLVVVAISNRSGGPLWPPRPRRAQRPASTKLDNRSGGPLWPPRPRRARRPAPTKAPESETV